MRRCYAVGGPPIGIFEDTPNTLNRRSKLMGLDLADFWGDSQFKYLRPGPGRLSPCHDGSHDVDSGRRRPGPHSH